MDMLKSSGFSCYVGNVFVGALAYADDITLLAPSRFPLGRLLKQCSVFLISYISLISMQIEVSLLFIAITTKFTMRK